MQEFLGTDVCRHIASYVEGTSLLETCAVNQWTCSVVRENCEALWLERIVEDFFPTEDTQFVRKRSNVVDNIPYASLCRCLSTEGKAWKAWSAWSWVAEQYGLKFAANGTSAYLKGYRSWQALKEAYRSLSAKDNPFAEAMLATLQPGLRLSLPNFVELLKTEKVLGKGFGSTAGQAENIATLFGLFVHHDGQSIDHAGSNMRLGILGGHTVYRRYVNCELLDLNRAIFASTTEGWEPESLIIVLSVSPLYLPRFVRYNFNTGAIESKHDHRPNWTPLITDAFPGENTVFNWLDAFSQRLKTGVFGVNIICRGPHKGWHQVSHFPAKTPNFGERTTNGIAVRVSMMRVHDYTSPWAYEISIRVLTPGEVGYVSPEDRGFHVAQLVSRTYSIPMSSGGPNQYVHGSAVTGYYPAIRDKSFCGRFEGSHHIPMTSPDEVQVGKTISGDPGWFVFQSALPEGCLGLSGFFTFVPGYILHQAGAPFKVHLPEMVLQDPGISW